MSETPMSALEQAVQIVTWFYPSFPAPALKGLLSKALSEGLTSEEAEAAEKAIDLYKTNFGNKPGSVLFVLDDARAALRTSVAQRRGPSLEKSAAVQFSGIAPLMPKPVDPEKIFSTERGVVAFKGAPDEKGRPQLIVLRTPPWAVRDLFGKGIVKLFVTAGAPLELSSGNYQTDLEFPGYLGKFVMGDQGHLALFPEEIGPARTILNLSYLGATWNVQRETLAKSYPAGADVPDLHAESLQIQSPFPTEGPGGLWQFHEIQRNGELAAGAFRLVHLGGNSWRIFENDVYMGDVDLNRYPVAAPSVTFMEESGGDPLRNLFRDAALVQGEPTVVSLGSGSGFTQEEASSHMVVDTNGEVTVVDPNIRVLEDLAMLGVPLKRVKNIVASHLHFDHVAGLWKLIRHLPHRPNLIVHANPGDIEAIAAGQAGEGEMSTLKGLVHMASQSTAGKISGDQFLGAVSVVPIRFGQPMQVGTYQMQFFHGNHAHPSYGYFIVNEKTGRPAFLFTGDTRMDAKTLHNAAVTLPGAEKPAPVMSDGRADFLSHMVANTLLAGGYVYADAGVAPIHPTVDFYTRMKAGFQAGGITGEALDEIMKHLHLYHNSKKAVEDAGFTYAGYGWFNTINLSKQLGWRDPGRQAVMSRLVRAGLLSVPVLANLKAYELDELAKLGTFRFYSDGNVLMKQGEDATSMMLILDGSAEIVRRNGGETVLATINSGLVGEAVFTGDKNRNADVRALTNVRVLEFGPDAIRYLKDKGIAARLIHLRELREKASAAGGGVEVLSELDHATKEAIFLRGDVMSASDGTAIIKEGDRKADFFVVLEGKVQVTASKGPLAAKPVLLGRGAVLGEGTLMGGNERSATVTAAGDVQLLRVDEQSARELLEKSGGDLKYYLLGLVQSRDSVKRRVAHPASGSGGEDSMYFSSITVDDDAVKAGNTITDEEAQASLDAKQPGQNVVDTATTGAATTTVTGTGGAGVPIPKL